MIHTKSFISAVFIISIVAASCSTHEPISFCEGISPQGEGVRCGNKFTTGDLTAVVVLKDRPYSNDMTLAIFKKTRFKTEKLSSHPLKKSAEKKAATATLSLYNEGTFLVRVLDKKNSVIAEQKLTIIDTY